MSCYLSYAMDEKAGSNEIANADYQTGHPEPHVGYWSILLRRFEVVIVILRLELLKY